MSLEAKVCRTYIDLSSVTKAKLISSILESRETLGLTAAQVEKIAKIVELNCDAQTETGLSVMQKIVASNLHVEGKEVSGKKTPKTSKSEAA